MPMPRSFYDFKPDPVKDRQSVEDFLAFRFPELTQLNNCRKQLALVRGERLELERRGSQQGLVHLKWEAVQLAGEIERLETLLGIKKEITNDTEVFYAVGGGIWKGTRRAIYAKGLKIDPLSQDFVPHQWLDESGFIDPELARKHPYTR